MQLLFGKLDGKSDGKSDGTLQRASKPRAMNVGYSNTPQARKLGLKSGQRVALDANPKGWSLTDPLELTYIGGADPADLIVAFFTESEQVVRRLPGLARRKRHHR